MSFVPGKLAVLAYANSFSLWHYDTEDDVEQFLAPGYFDEMTKLARRGDLVFVSRGMSGSPHADLLLVTEVNDNWIRIEALQRGGEAHDLAALHDVRLQQPEAEQVLAFDGEAWVNRPNAGAAGDAHAALRGNPHNTSSTDVGAVPAAEKGVPEGLATLDANGCVPLAQLRNLALANLREIAESHPEIGFVLRFDGTTWVASPEMGQAGDAHACLTGNPHRTTASDVGAVTVTEKGVAGGVASLGADGKVPAEQLPPAGSADQIVDTPTKVMMTGAERSKLSAIEEKATAAGAVGDAFAASHGGAGGDAHATACASAAGFMSTVDKVKLDGIAEGATRNPALATQEEIAAGTGTDARLLTPALVKQAVATHSPIAAADSVTNVALANMAAARIKGRANGAGLGDPQDLTPVQVRAIINVADGATAAGALGDSHAAMTGNPHQTVADQIADTPTKVLMTADERSKLSSVELGATAAGKAGDAFALAHPGTGGSAHATASATAAGFLSAGDKQKLDGIAPLAAPNPAVATPEEITAGSGTEPRLVTPAQIKQAVVTFTPPPAVDTVDNTALANMPAARLKGRASGAGTGDPQDLTAAQARLLLNVADGAAPTPPTLEDTDIVAGTATAIGSVTPAKLKLAAATHGKGGAAFKTIAITGQPALPASAPEDTLNLVAGANVTLTTDPATKSVSIAATSSGGSGSAFAEVYVAGKPLIAARKTGARIELKAGPGIALASDTENSCVTFTTISLGASSSYWNACNPSFGESSPGAGDGGLKTSNTAVKNKAVFTDIFNKMNAAAADNMFLQVPAGTYDLIGSISPSGRDQDFETGSRLTILFERCVFNFVGSRTDYNQVQYNAGGWKTLDTFATLAKKPFKRGDAKSGRPIPFLDAKGYPRPHGVLFDVSRCSAGDKGIDVRGYLELRGPNGATSAGFVGISASRALYGFAKGSTWDAVKISGCSVGLLSLYITQTGTDQGDGFTSSQWNLLDIRNGTRALIFDSNGADMMSVGKATFACQDTSYIFRTHLNIGSAFFATTTPDEISLTDPNPKIFECMGTLNIGALYARGDKAPTRAWSVINVANEGVLNIGCLHGDSNHDSQIGTHITLAKSDNDHASLAGSVTIGGTGTDTTTSPISYVVGVAPVAGAKRYVNAVAINVPSGGKSAPPVGVIPDYKSDKPAAVDTSDYLNSFSFDTGFSQQKISKGALVTY